MSSPASFNLDRYAEIQTGGYKRCAFGDLQLAGKQYAVASLTMIVFKEARLNRLQEEDFLNEVNTLLYLKRRFPDSPFLVSLIHYTYDTIFLERCLCDLKVVIKTNINPLSGQRLTHRDRRVFAHHIVHATQYLHRNGLVHKDIKPRNILINRRWQRAQLADFSYMALIDSKASRSFCGTPQFLAPEFFWAKGKNMRRLARDSIVTAADSWSVGLTLHLLYNGFLPSIFEDGGIFALYSPDTPALCLSHFRKMITHLELNPSTNIYGLLNAVPSERTPLDQVMLQLEQEIGEKLLCVTAPKVHTVVHEKKTPQTHPPVVSCFTCLNPAICIRELFRTKVPAPS